MIADDDQDFVEVLKERLESSGYDTVVAYEGIRTIEMAHRERPDLILLDWKMPVGGGAVVLQGLREKEETKQIPIIILTGFSDAEIEDTAIKFGVSIVIRKPYDAKVLLRTIREVLQIHSFMKE
jgi:DNA-binding response OmpR family regulator